MRKNKPYKPFLLAAGWLFSGLVMASGSGTLAPVVVSLANGGQLDFTNFYEDLMNNQKIPDSGALTEKVKEQIADQLKQAGK
ncbi:hypothetical protein S679_004267 [Salmonella enterica subsp. enterica]|nr:hypothetical protein [Salmonella enterica subsp. enterica serovar Carmel]EDU8832216.1 hypothetical protein [Salmonella enterica subsp. enterica]